MSESIRSIHGQCADINCGGPLTKVTFSCGDHKGNCMTVHHGFQCSVCHSVYETRTTLHLNTRPVNIKDVS